MRLAVVDVRPVQPDRAARMGRLASLMGPYVKVGVPGLLGLLGAVAFLEILFHARHSSVGDSVMSVFGITFDHHSILPWILSAAVAVIGFGVARHFAPEAKEAFD
ncbi:MAG: hypothetical protein AAFV62_07360, partial [Pseudomonadota bacterium]